MRKSIGIGACALIAALAACQDSSSVAPSPRMAVTRGATPNGFVTSQTPQAYPVVPSATVFPILTVGDSLDNGFRWAPTPDGLGAYQDGGNLIVFANHELTSGGVGAVGGGAKYKFARVSRLVLDIATLAVRDASYVVDSTAQYQRLCSATWADAAAGLPGGYFLTGEETVGALHDGIQVAVGRDGSVHELPWLGRFNHENEIAIPGFPGRVVLAGFDDTRGASELYLYVATNEAAVLAGTGKLYVFTSSGAARSGDLTEGQSIQGSFVEVPGAAALSSSQLQTTVNGLGAFPFVRLEDGDYDHRPGQHAPAIYFVDTGAEAVKCGLVSCDPHGSIYRMEFNASNPTTGARLTLLLRSRGADQEWASPDNVAAGKNSLMVMEDPAYAGFVRAPRIYNFHSDATGGFQNRGVAVVELPNPECSDALGTCWESSGIIDASAWLGSGTWLFDTQAHTLPVPSLGLTGESGQLLLLRLPGS